MSNVHPPPPPRLLDQLRQEIRYLHYSIRTEQAYVHWVRAFVRFHDLRHPAELGHGAVESFLTWLATEQQVSVSTHKQALSALLFLYQKVLRLSVPWLNEITRPQRAPRLPVVLSQDEVARVLAALPDDHRLFGHLLYGTGMRLLEGLRLRVKDIEFEQRAIIVREGKGAKDRVVMLPASLDAPLRHQLSAAHALWSADRAAGVAGVQVPDALDRKYPRAPMSWAWFWVFAQGSLSTDPRTGVLRRHHQYEQGFQRAFKRALQAAGIAKPASPHTLSSGDAAGVVDRADHLKVQFGILSDPVDEHPNDIITRHSGRSRVGQDIAYEYALLLAFHARPVTECLLDERLELFTLHSRGDLLVLQVDPRHDLDDRCFLLADFILEHANPLFEEAVDLRLFAFGPCTGKGREDAADERDSTASDLERASRGLRGVAVLRHGAFGRWRDVVCHLVTPNVKANRTVAV